MKPATIGAIAVLLITAVGFIGCGGEEESAEAGSEGDTDSVSAASIVDTAGGFRKAAGENGTWIIAATDDITAQEELVVEGRFTHRDEVYRKIALYAQDEDRNITDRYTLTAPRLVVRSENTRIQGGTFKGEVYVDANGFHIVDGRVDGDIVFSSQVYKTSFNMEDGEVTGELIVE